METGLAFTPWFLLSFFCLRQKTKETGETKTGAEPYSITYSYDAGNRTTRLRQDYGGQAETTYTYNNGNQLVSLNHPPSTINYVYDNNGNLISETDGTNTTNYTWDWENRLVGISNSQFLISNEYDSFGKRIAVTENGVTTNYLYDGGLPIIEKDATDTTIATYTRGLSLGGGIGGIVSANRGGNNYYYHYNGIGGVTGLTDESSAIVSTYNYDSYGNTLSSTGSIPNPYGFSTKEFSSVSGLAYFGARYYNPQTGRWLSQDPLGMVNGPNLYAYCGNNATNLVDSWGMVAMTPIYPMPDINSIISEALAEQKNCFNGLDSPTNIDDPYEILRLAWLRYGDGNFDFKDYHWLIGNLLTDYTGMWGFYIYVLKLIVIDKSVLLKPYLLIASTMLHEVKHFWGAGDREAYLAQNQLIRRHLPGWHGWIGPEIYRPSDW